MKRNTKGHNTDYAHLKMKLLARILISCLVAMLTIFLLYIVFWRGRGSEWVVSIIMWLFHIDYSKSVFIYKQIVRDNQEIIWFVAIVIVFMVLLRIVLNWLTRYFDMVNQGIDALLSDDTEIHLPSEMVATERKLMAVKQKLKQRTLEAQLAEQRKNDLVMYLAHDIRTPLTSVIGYLNLMTEAPDMPTEQKAKYLRITLDKANRLEKMINEFFEITMYNQQQITINKEHIDLYYMLVQLIDELSPTLSAKGIQAVLKADEDLTVYGDPDKLARVFNNILKNAAAYSYPDTQIPIVAEEKEGTVIISISNQGEHILQNKLTTIFDKFSRLDEARTSDTGGAGLGLAIAKEIIVLHGGHISATCEAHTITFVIQLPKC